jgi:DNA mismatch endonuclease (patch repair protein)
MDRISKAARSETMRRIRSRGTRSTERRLRAFLARGGFRGWRVQALELPGTPDFAFDYRKLAVFVDGCFWHGCPDCYRRPHSRRIYWDQKVERNTSRDHRVDGELRAAGWSVLRIWEHDLKSYSEVVGRIGQSLGGARGAPARLK